MGDPDYPPATHHHSLPDKLHPVRGYVLIAAATFFWGLSATMGRAVFTGRIHIAGHQIAPIDPLILAQSRTTISWLLLAPMLWLFHRSALRVRPSHLAQFFLLGIVGLASANYFYYFSIQKTSVATAIVLQYVAPVWVLLYMVARRLQRPTLQRVTGVVLAVLGCGIAVGEVAARAGFPWLYFANPRFNTLGVIAAEIAAVSFAFYNIYCRHLLQQYKRWTVLVYALLGATVFWQIVNPPWKVVAHHYDSGQWLFMAIFSVMSMLIPFSLYFAGLQHLDPTRAIVTACLEPVWAILLTALILGELVSAMQVVGIGVVLLATVLVQRPEGKGNGEPVIAVDPIE